MRILLVVALFLVAGCGCHEEPPYDETTAVGTFEGRFDDVVTGYNFPFDIAVVPTDPAEGEDGILAGDILAADYGTSQVLIAPDPGDPDHATAAEVFYDGTADGLGGATAVSIPPSGHVWATFEQGGEGDMGAIVVLSRLGDVLAILDGAADAAAFAHPSGICWGAGFEVDGAARERLYFVNLDGTAWRLEGGLGAEEPTFARVGGGLATGTAGNPGTASAPLSSSGDLPQDGARGCVYAAGSLYVADAQNARVVRFDDVEAGADLDPIALEDAPPELITYPTDVAINSEGALIVISYDNAHAFVALETPTGGFLDNGLYDLNVNSGNYGVALTADTIWFTRANNSNGSLRAITRDMQTPPATLGPIPAQ